MRFLSRRAGEFLSSSRIALSAKYSSLAASESFLVITNLERDLARFTPSIMIASASVGVCGVPVELVRSFAGCLGLPRGDSRREWRRLEAEAVASKN